jgi:hypothetical protein
MKLIKVSRINMDQYTRLRKLGYTIMVCCSETAKVTYTHNKPTHTIPVERIEARQSFAKQIVCYYRKSFV